MMAQRRLARRERQVAARHAVPVHAAPIAGALLLLVCATLLGVPRAAAQQPTIQYVYDDLGRLVVVVDQQGQAAIYLYDLVGNILGIQRFNLAGIPDAVAIVSVTPNKGKVGTPVLILGKGFSPDPLQNTVSFTGALARVNASTPFSISTSVPAGAITGSITVATPLGSATSPTPFSVLEALTVSPANAALLQRATLQFGATEAGNPTPPVTWSVNGITGGDSTLGTISTTGFYTAPATIPLPPRVTVTATHNEDRTLSASALVSIVTPPDKILTHEVSVGFAAPTSITIDKSVTTSVSVQVAGAAAAPGFANAPAVAVALEPAITGVSPASAAPGTSNLTVTITGLRFSGATGLSLLLNGVPDGNVTVANLVVNLEGTQATATISIAAAAAPGIRVAQITTPVGTSTAADTGSNRFTVQ